ncbi:hypothetical protein V5O48_000122 [Marasmius crinis-equi]|uniref:Uncharacterized protein n=1 Tax=Marasmius crinis-equi TaxID=585013 RepID=A0ABR3G226_9AGAR
MSFGGNTDSTLSGPTVVPEPFTDDTALHSDQMTSLEPVIDNAMDEDNDEQYHGVSIEEVPDEDLDDLYVERFPRAAGAYVSHGKTRFHTIEEVIFPDGCEVLGPFRDEEEWELARWLIKNVGHNQAEAFLKLPIIQNRLQLSFENKKEYLEKIDSLPRGTEWKLHKITLEGDLKSDDGSPLTEDVELWYRDPIECIRELMGNPMFREATRYVPEKLFTDAAGTNEVFNEMWTAEWWWKIQERLPEGATVTPVILSSDKTKLSQFRGDQSAWPVYLTIGNISKDVRKKISSHSTILIGYLPVPKVDCYSSKERQFARYRLFHHCMGIILDSLVKAGKEGVDMTCSDGLVRWAFPILAAYVADYPEQCLVACCMENRCPLCKVMPEERGSFGRGDARTKAEALRLLNPSDVEDKRNRDEAGIRDISRPFWAKLPHSDIFEGFTPDLLHQLHKGVFKDHLVKWVTELVGESELDERIKAMPEYPGLRHFKNGISMVSQWTGAEYKAMEKVLLGAIVDVVDKDVVVAVKSILDFIHLASLQTHTTKTLEALAAALSDFHSVKDIFIQLEARDAPHFNIPKIHSMMHYVELIRRFGSADGFNTETPERLHIDYAKDAYRASNRKDYVIQMTRWLERQEAVDCFAAVLAWRKDPDAYAKIPAISGADSHPDTNQPLPLPTSAIYRATLLPTLVPPPHLLSHFRIAETHRPEYRSITIEFIANQLHASHFLPAIHSYLFLKQSSIIPRPLDSFDLFKQITFTLPEVVFSSPPKSPNIISTSIPIPANGRKPAEPARSGFALIKTDKPNTHTANTPLEGMCYFIQRRN